VVLLGPPGAGKGTQAEILAKRRSLTHISTGALFRDAVRDGSSIGREAKSYLDRGELVPDPIVLELIRERLPRAGGFLLDGFPRNLAQAVALDDMLKGAGRKVDWVVCFELGERILMERLLGRGRSDDTADTIQKRLEVYRRETEPLISYYRERGKLQAIDGSRTVEEVGDAVESALKGGE
jgi:adenylate kinase